MNVGISKLFELSAIPEAALKPIAVLSFVHWYDVAKLFGLVKDIAETVALPHTVGSEGSFTCGNSFTTNVAVCPEILSKQP